MKKYNFSPGPAILPRSVIEEAAKGVLNIYESGLSILEVSHRGPEVTDILNEAESLLKELYAIPEHYSVLFLSGGASSQFFMVPMNLLGSNDSAAYIDTGAWSSKAIKEAKKFGHIDVIASSSAQQYNYIPSQYDQIKDHKYCHITTNNTIYGTQFQSLPDLGLPLVGDCSSDFLSKPIDISKFDVIYAGAQKNLGPAGVTVVIIKNEAANRLERDIPTMLDYRTHIAKKSTFNTPPVFPIYVSLLTMRWLKSKGGLEVIDQENQQKASKIYQEIDRNSLFKGIAQAKDRSLMNATFICNNADHVEPFLQACNQAGISGIKGHRSVGGFRASIYNAMDLVGIEKLVELMQEFENIHA